MHEDVRPVGLVPQESEAIPGSDARILIVGAGPTGLGAARRLVELGHRDWELYEAADGAGGLATSVVDDAGFTWDLGGHVLYSHYPYFDALMREALGDAWLDHRRDAQIWMRGRFVPYPFQNNLWRLPQEDVEACLAGLDARDPAAPPPRNYRDWLLATFGRGMCDTFLFPYNAKVWAYPPERLAAGWTRERVAPVDAEKVRRSVELRRDDPGWGPNATFRFPERGGTGAIWNAVRAMLPAARLHFGRRVVSVNTRESRVTFADGTAERCDHLVSSIPLDRLLAMLEDRPDLSARAKEFVHSSTHVVGIGVDGTPPETVGTKTWIYFPDADIPFYRVIVFSSFSPNNVAKPGRQWSVTAEVSESPEKPVDASRVVADTEDGLRRAGLLPGDARIVTRWHRRLEHGYPTPWLGRDAVLDAVEPELAAAGILSRGRFGAWRYEVSNQDHSLLQGVEAVNRILLGEEERTAFARAGTS